MKNLFCSVIAILVMTIASAQPAQTTKQVPQKSVSKQGTPNKTKTMKPGSSKPGTNQPQTNNAETKKPGTNKPQTKNPGSNTHGTAKTQSSKTETSQEETGKMPTNKRETNKSEQSNPGINNTKTINTKTDSADAGNKDVAFIKNNNTNTSVTGTKNPKTTIPGTQSMGPQIAGSSPCKDITNAILTRNSPFCKNYVGNYCATVKDVNVDTTFNAKFSISHIGGVCIILTDAIPNHDFNDNPEKAFPADNKVKKQNYRFVITDHPAFATRITPLSLDRYNAVLLDGAVVDLLSDGCCCHDKKICGDGIIGCNDINYPWRKDPMFRNGEFNPDSHNAHSQPDGTYHYHGPPNTLYDTSGEKESPVIGFAADGFPIYGPYINDNGTIRSVTSSYQLKTGDRPKNSCPGEEYDGTYIDDYEYVAGSGDLDECNGMTRNGHYGYYVTFKYPYMINAFKGTPDDSFKKKPAMK
jgi:hypothetical protein